MIKRLFTYVLTLSPVKVFASAAVIGLLGMGVITLTIDMMEYATDGAAQSAYVTSATTYTAQYPTTHNATYVKATSYEGSYYPYLATDPTKSLTGGFAGTSWLAEQPAATNQRFHIDLGSSKIINRIYYENFHTSGSSTDIGVKNFTFWGSDNAAAFAELTYATDTNWTQITGLSDSQFDQHTASNVVDPKYSTITGNTTAYRYYAFKIADNWGDGDSIGIRHIALQNYALQSYSEDTIIAEGTYSLKLSATTDALNDTVTKTLTGGDILDLTGKDSIKFDIRCTGTGASIIQAQITDVGTTNSTHSITISSADTFEAKTWDISAISAANKDAINKIIFKILNAASARDFYIDNLKAE